MDQNSGCRQAGKNAFSHTRFLIVFPERIMSDVLEEFGGMISLCGKTVTSLQLADNIDAPAEKEQKLEAQIESPGKTCTRYIQWR